MLRREGYEVITAANGVEAIGGMSAGVHIVITDLRMPGSTAWSCSAAVGRVPRRAGHHDHRARHGRQRGRGDQARRVRLHREAVRAGADPSGRRQGDEHRHARPPRRAPRRAVGARPLPSGRPVARDAADLRRRREGRRHAVDRADHRRDRHRQGARRPRAARELARARRAVHQDQLRRDPEDADGVRAVRLREGRVHRRASAPSRAASSSATAARCSSTRSARSRSRCR